MPPSDHETKVFTPAGADTDVDSRAGANSSFSVDGIAALQRFKQLWRDQTPPDLPAFVKAAGLVSEDLLAAILRADLHYRWEVGRTLPVEWYFEQFEQLAASPELAVDLIYAEYLQAEKHGQPSGPEEYFLRFPQHRETLRDQFELHSAIGDVDQQAPAAVELYDDEEAKGDRKLPLPGFPHVPGYQILEEVGRGGIGVVYRAHDPRLNRIVALKLLLSGAHASTTQLRRIQIEAEAAARLQHPGIVQIHEIGQHDGRPYLALEFVSGGNLADRYRGQPQAPRMSAALVEQLARTVEFAHQHGIIHRDLKPANVLLEESGEYRVASGEDAKRKTATQPISNSSTSPSRNTLPLPKITDFGLAKLTSLDTVALTDDATHSGDVIGTPSYMSPEQATGRVRDTGAPTDVYSLGAILYELLTGRPPFVGATPIETMRQVAESEPVHPSRLVRAMPTDLQTICLKCLEKLPHKRYATARELADDLQRFLANRPIVARRTGSTEKTWRWMRRNPTVTGLIGIVLCLLATGLPTMTGLFLRERTQAARAEENFHLALSAVEQYLTNVGDSPELKSHGLESLRQNLLLTAKNFYEQLGKRRGDDRAFQADLAQAHHRLAYISREMGDLNSAVEQYSLMRDVAIALVRDHPQDQESLQLLGQSQSLLGHVHQELGNSEAAELEMSQARSAFEQLVHDAPASPSFRLELAALVLDLRSLYGTLDRKEDEEKCFHEAQRLCAKLIANPPDIAEAGSLLANTYDKMAVAYMNRGMFPEAEGSYRVVRDIAQQLTEKFPDDPHYAADLARHLVNFAVMFTRQGRNEEARAAFENSAMLLDRLIVEHPLIVDYQAVAAGNWLNIGSLEFSAGNWKQADIAWREAQRRYAALQSRNPNVPGYALDYAKSCSNLGNVCFMRQQYSACETYYADAIAVVEALVDSQPESVELRGFLVGIQSNLASAYQALKQDDKAISLYENAAHVQRQLVQSQPTVLEHQRRLAASLISLANVHHKMSSYASAETVIHEGCELTKRLVQEHADTPDYADMRGDALKLLGNILFDSDRFDEAVAAYQESLSVREQLVRDHVEVALYRTKLGQVQFLLGRVAREMNRLEEAIDWFDRAIEQYQPIWQVLEGEGAAESKAIREALCDARWAKAGALYRLERGSDALVECDLALGYETGDYADGLHALRARVLARIGRMDEALHEAKSVDTSQNLSAPALVDLAAVYSLARAPHAQEPEYGSRCMELLRKAKAKSQRYMVGIEKDPDFKGLEGWDNAALTSPAPRP